MWDMWGTVQRSDAGQTQTTFFQVFIYTRSCAEGRDIFWTYSAMTASLFPSHQKGRTALVAASRDGVKNHIYSCK